MREIPPTEKTPHVLTPSEHAMQKRKEKLTELYLHGDPFYGRFVCEMQDIYYYALEIVFHYDKVRLSRPPLHDGVGGSTILDYHAWFTTDLSPIKPLFGPLQDYFQPYRIGYSLWMYTYSFANFEEMIRGILEVLLHNPSSQIPMPKQLEALANVNKDNPDRLACGPHDGAPTQAVSYLP